MLRRMAVDFSASIICSTGASEGISACGRRQDVIVGVRGTRSRMGITSDDACATEMAMTGVCRIFSISCGCCRCHTLTSDQPASPLLSDHVMSKR